jgi:hypothetical protein
MTVWPSDGPKVKNRYLSTWGAIRNPWGKCCNNNILFIPWNPHRPTLQHTYFMCVHFCSIFISRLSTFVFYMNKSENNKCIWNFEDGLVPTCWPQQLYTRNHWRFKKSILYYGPLYTRNQGPKNLGPTLSMFGPKLLINKCQTHPPSGCTFVGLAWRLCLDSL